MAAHVMFFTGKEADRAFTLATQAGIIGILEEDKTKSQSSKTHEDILADLSAVRIGDTLYLYLAGKGFFGRYKAASTGYISYDDVPGIFPNGDGKIIPYRLHIEPDTYYPCPAEELRIFEIAGNSGTLYFKKVLNRGKALNHIFPLEEKALERALVEYNGLKSIPYPNFDPFYEDHIEPILFNLETDKFGELRFEKSLEGHIIQNIRVRDPIYPLNKHLINSNLRIFIGNYIPLAIDQTTADIFCIYRSRESVTSSGLAIPAVYIAELIELKKSRLRDFDINHMEGQVSRYTDAAIKLGFERNVIYPYIIALSFSEGFVNAFNKPICGLKYRTKLLRYTVAPANYSIQFMEV